jgi:hypothetical protein
MYVRGTLATILSSIGNWCFDTAQRLELSGKPGSYAQTDTSDRPFGAPPDIEPRAPDLLRSHRMIHDLKSVRRD